MAVRIMGIVLWVVFAAGLAGCAVVGPDYKTRGTKLDAAFTGSDQDGFSSEQINVTWWRGFNDTTLNQLVEVALSANHDLRIATANLLEARALRLQSEFDRYPTITAGGFFTKEQLSKAVLLSSTARREIV